MDPRVQAMGDVLVQYSTGVKSGDWVVIQSTTLGAPLARACVSATLSAGGNPSVFLADESIQETVVREGSDDQLSFISPAARAIMEGADVNIGLLAPANTRSMASADPARLAVQAKATEPLSNMLLQRAARGELRWTGAQYPTNAAAQDANMSLRAYENFVYTAGLLDRPDPIAAWRELGERQERIVDWLSDKETVHITGQGTDLTLSIAGRTWINDCGHENFPGGEVFTGPVEDSAEGHIEFSYPAFYRGREVSGVRLVFRAGKVVEASATADEAFLHGMLDMDEGSRRLGEFAFGTNPGIQTFTKNTLFDEKMGGTLHMALGRAYEETGGTNVSALHWDMVFNLRQDAEVRVDGQVFSKNGELQI